jgi:hypothetical protein
VTSNAPAASSGAVASPVDSPAIGGGSGTCGSGDVKSALQAAASAQHAADSYRVTGTIKTATVLEAMLEIQKPDRIHVKAGAIEFIGIGDTTWRNVGGTWQEAPGTDVQSLVGGMGQLDAEVINDATFTKVTSKSATVNGAGAIEYDYHESIPDELDADVQLWLDPATCRPIRNVATGNSSSTAPTFDVTYSDWNAVTVNAPE